MLSPEPPPAFISARCQSTDPVPGELTLVLRRMLLQGCGGAIVIALITITQVCVVVVHTLLLINS